MLSKFLSYIKDQNLPLTRGTTLLAVSGGMDSMTLCQLFLEASLPFAVAHVNHNARGIESDMDRDFVRNWAMDHSKPFHEKSLDENISKAGNFQAKARKERRMWMETLCDEFGYIFIATGHHFNDEVETFFINLLRGSGLRGLSGFKAKDGRYIKPLLFARRKEIEDYVVSNNIEFRHDISNDSIKYLRNKIRLNVMPQLFSDDDFAAFQRSQQHILNSYLLLDHFIMKDEIVEFGEDAIIVNIEKLNICPSAVTVLWHLTMDMGFKESQLLDILSAKENSASISSHSHEIVFDRSKLYIIQTQDEIQTYFVEEVGSFGKNETEVIHIESIGYEEVDFSSDAEYLGFEVDPFPLVIRKPQHGDKFRPLGMSSGHQLISDYVANMKLNPVQKKRIRLITFNENIVCIPGYRVSEDFKVSDRSKYILKILGK